MDSKAGPRTSGKQLGNCAGSRLHPRLQAATGNVAPLPVLGGLIHDYRRAA